MVNEAEALHLGIQEVCFSSSLFSVVAGCNTSQLQRETVATRSRRR
jgi:hypothetical protein